MYRPQHYYYVYILASRSRVLYIGLTSRLAQRVRQHCSGDFGGFTTDYKVHRLVYFERFVDVRTAISREKQLKRWRRGKKVALIERENPTWEDLSAEWREPPQLRMRSDV
jgi:putative endonuclease